jgi:isopentenyldiphosphate isomerase
VCYIVEITNTKISMEDGELENGEFLSISQIEEMMKSDEYDVENWSQIIYDEIKNSISK